MCDVSCRGEDTCLMVEMEVEVLDEARDFRHDSLGIYRVHTR